MLDVDERRLDLDVPWEEVRRRLERLGPPEARYRRGYGALHLDHVLQADQGCDFDLLRSLPGETRRTRAAWPAEWLGRRLVEVRPRPG